MGKRQRQLSEPKEESPAPQKTQKQPEKVVETKPELEKVIKKTKKTHKRLKQTEQEADQINVSKETEKVKLKQTELKEEVKKEPIKTEDAPAVQTEVAEAQPLPGIETLFKNENLSAFQLEERKKRTIFVGNIPIDLPAKKVWHVFKNCGKVEKIWFRSIPPSSMITDRRNIVKGKLIGNQKNNKNAYILFEDESSIDAALKLNGFLIQEEPPFHLRVDRDVKKEDDYESTLFIGNLPFIINEEELRAHFESLGKIKNIRIVRDPRTLIGVGIAFIQMENKEEIIKAVTE